MEWLYIINVLFVFISWHLASRCYDNGNKIGFYFNMFASALNGVIVFMAVLS